MRQIEKVTGSVEGIVKMLQSAAKVSTEKHFGKTYFWGSTPEADRLDAEFERICAEQPDRYRKWSNARQELMCDYQIKKSRIGYTPCNLGDNFYGWAVGSTLRSNIGGGRWSMTARGLTLEQAIETGIEFTATPNYTFTLYASSLPPEVTEALQEVSNG